MKKGIKCNILMALIALLSVFTFSVINVNAQTIKESTDVNSTYDHIEDGTIIIGITKFSPNTILTARRSSTATMNDVLYNSNNGNYGGVKIYYYISGMWFELDDNNTPTLLSDAAMSEQDIFYVDNVEKTIDIEYSGDTNVTVKTDKANKDKLVKVANGKITVPATVNNFRVLNNRGATVASYFKANDSDVTFLENPIMGRLVSHEDSNSDLVSLGDDISLTFQGNVDYKISPSEDEENGNMISVGIRTTDNRIPEDKENTIFVVKDARSTETRFTWGEDNDDVERRFDVMFSNDVREATIDVIWEEGNRQTFKVYLTDSSSLEEVPEGKISHDGEIGFAYENGEQLNFPMNTTSVKNTIQFTGTIGYTEDTNLLGSLEAGNRVGIVIYPADKYTGVSGNSVKVDVEGALEDEDSVIEWADMAYGRGIHYVPKITDDNRIIKIRVTWEQGFTQVFTIDATKAVLQSKPVVETE